MVNSVRQVARIAATNTRINHRNNNVILHGLGDVRHGYFDRVRHRTINHHIDRVRDRDINGNSNFNGVGLQHLNVNLDLHGVGHVDLDLYRVRDRDLYVVRDRHINFDFNRVRYVYSDFDWNIDRNVYSYFDRVRDRDVHVDFDRDFNRDIDWHIDLDLDRERVRNRDVDAHFNRYFHLKRDVDRDRDIYTDVDRVRNRYVHFDFDRDVDTDFHWVRYIDADLLSLDWIRHWDLDFKWDWHGHWHIDGYVDRYIHGLVDFFFNHCAQSVKVGATVVVCYTVNVTIAWHVNERGRGGSWSNIIRLENWLGAKIWLGTSIQTCKIFREQRLELCRD